MKISKPLVPVLILMLLSVFGCSELTRSDKPPLRSWWLTPYTGMAKTGTATTATPIILTVRAVPGLDTDHVLTLSGDSELIPYAGSRWVDNLPELTGSLVRRTLEASGRFEAVSGRAGALGVCDLQLDLREFFALLGAQEITTSVQIAISGRYQCESGPPLSLQLSAAVPVNDHRMKTIVAAFQQATDRVLKDLLEQLP